MTLESRLWQVGNVITLAVVLLAARIVYWTLLRGDELRPQAVSLAAAEAYMRALQGEEADAEAALGLLHGESAFAELPQPVIQRTMDLLRHIRRGRLLDRNGRPLAFDQAAGTGRWVRVYAEPSLAHLIGYVSGIRAGIVGLELTYNDSLLGLDRLDAQLARATHEPIEGSELVLTIDSGLQRAAEAALSGRAGAVVVLDGATGAILAMASQPGLEPNRVLDPAYMQDLLAGCPGPECQGAFVNRATQGLYAPGSTFKTVTLIAALDTGQVSPETVFDFGQARSGPNGPYYVYEVGGGVIPDPNHSEAHLNLEMSYAKSANAAFARIGDEMPADVLVDYAGRFGIGVPPESALRLEVPMATPQLAGDVRALYSNAWLRAATAIGQGELLVNPLSMAMVVLAVVNQGDVPVPYVVDAIRHPGGEALAQQPARRVLRGLMQPRTAELVRGMMITTAEQGSGRPALVEGLTVGGKTGTAQVGEGVAPHAWFIGFAQGQERSVVIAIVVERAGEGHDVAAPLFASLADTAVRHLGEAVEDVGALPVGPPPAESAAPPVPDLSLGAGKLDVMAGAGACSPDQAVPTAPPGGFAWPAEERHRRLVGDDFGPRHPGIDLGTPPGAPVYAAAAGLVVFSNWTDVGYGNTVVIDHGGGYQTLYGHLSLLRAACGSQVETGALIGLAGATGNAFGPHLHFEIRVPGGFLNPWPQLPPP